MYNSLFDFCYVLFFFKYRHFGVLRLHFIVGDRHLQLSAEKIVVLEGVTIFLKTSYNGGGGQICINFAHNLFLHMKFEETITSITKVLLILKSFKTRKNYLLYILFYYDFYRARNHFFMQRKSKEHALKNIKLLVCLEF